jgi:hypothetical protein
VPAGADRRPPGRARANAGVRVYLRRGGCKIRIRAPKGSPEFARAYAEAVDALENPTGRHAGGAGSGLFRLSPIQIARSGVASDPPRHHRGLPTGAA